jgi:glycine cleavage system H protein
MYPSNLKYAREHEWVRPENSKATLGISHYAQDKLGTIVYIELPEVGTQVKANVPFAQIESTKAVNDIYTPITGEIVEINENVIDEPELINKDPYGNGWLVIIEMSDPTELETLLSAEEYQKSIKE